MSGPQDKERRKMIEEARREAIRRYQEEMRDHRRRTTWMEKLEDNRTRSRDISGRLFRAEDKERE
jgi:hypothetical protein